MSRKYIDCRENTDPENKCTVAISADTDDEVLETAVQHGITAHGMQDSPDLRKELRTWIKEE
jgi:predicted small metal-binding protein